MADVIRGRQERAAGKTRGLGIGGHLLMPH